MPPFEVIDSVDPFTRLVQFRTSPVYECIVSIRTLLKAPRLQEVWAQRARESLSGALLQELVYLYQNFNDGGIYFELPVDYQDHDDVPHFFDYVRRLSDADFMFYILGRIVPRTSLRTNFANGNVIRELVSNFGESDHFHWYVQNLDPILKDIAAFRDRLCDAWETYWDEFFQNEIPAIEPQWATGLRDKRNMLERDGGRTLFEKVTGKQHLPSELPRDVPYSSITFIPVGLLPSPVYQFFGYGNVTILFNPQYTEERRLAIQTARKEAESTLKALDDSTRLDILRMIVEQGDHLHGKLIAEKKGISASAVSRHLALLKDGGLIDEEPQKNLITYKFRKETLTDLVNKLLDYLYS